MQLEGRHFASGAGLRLTIQSGRIAAVEPAPVDPQAPLIAPGLVDLQINGFAGFDFNDPACDVAAAVQTIKAGGVSRLLPTLVTGSPERLAACAARIAAACAADAELDHAIAGIHLEGPAISPEDGPRGAHPLEWVRPLSWTEFTRLQQAAGGRIRLVTLAPEQSGSIELIQRLCAEGVKVALGHTDASPQQIDAAVAAGASCSTHLGNGARPVLPRHPNIIWSQLAHDALWCGAIADGHHLPAEVLKVFARVKGERLFLVSDAVAKAGMPPGRYTDLIGGDVVLTPEGKLHTAADPRILAGAAKSLWEGIRFITEAGVMSLAQALHAAAVVPAHYLGWQHGLEAGAPADLFILEGDRPQALVLGR
ncbi:MAG TPA: amidohydrolase family protein [Limnochordia bacterium]|nr:amidohydrolase family protein [Limnochordia bacterium]